MSVAQANIFKPQHSKVCSDDGCDVGVGSADEQYSKFADTHTHTLEHIRTYVYAHKYAHMHVNNNTDGVRDGGGGGNDGGHIQQAVFVNYSSSISSLRPTMD